MVRYHVLAFPFAAEHAGDDELFEYPSTHIRRKSKEASGLIGRQRHTRERDVLGMNASA
jgi:hypothetical protein